MKFTFRKLLLLVFVVGVIAALVVASLPKPTAVEWEEITEGPFEVTVDADGQTRCKQRFIVKATTMGELQRITLSPGDKVEKGQAVATILAGEPPLKDPQTRKLLEANVKAAQAEVEKVRAEIKRAEELRKSAQEQLDQAQKDYELLDDIISQRALRAAENNVREVESRFEPLRAGETAALSQLEAARARLHENENDKRQTRDILSPITGEVLVVYPQSSDGPVQPGTPLMEIGDPHDLEMVVDVLSTDAVSIHPGDRVYIDQWGGDPLEGIVRNVEKKAFMKPSVLGVEERRVNIIVDFTSAKDKLARLGDGFRVEARIVVIHKDRVLQAPVSALQRLGDNWSVFVINGGKAIQREVQLGERNDRQAEVIEGLTQGDRVVIHPSNSLYDGASIKLRKSDRK